MGSASEPSDGDLLRTWMGLNGWHKSTEGAAGTLWQKGLGTVVQIVIPHGVHRASWEWPGILERTGYPDPDAPQPIPLLVCPDCTLMMSFAKGEDIYDPAGTRWLCWNCDRQIGVTWKGSTEMVMT